jgi:hypothetical protein
LRIAHSELVYTLEAFRKLSAPEICRRYGLGQDWLDAERNEQADHDVEVSYGAAPQA